MPLFRRRRGGEFSAEEAARIVNRLGSIIDQVEANSVQAPASLPWVSHETLSRAERRSSSDARAEPSRTTRGASGYLDPRDRRDGETPLAAQIG